MSRIRVMVVDDSAMLRRLITDALSGADDIEVVGVAPNGQIAVSQIDELRPDVITLDVEMPVMDGLQTVREIRKRHTRLPVIMFSTLTEEGGWATLDALSHGASDYLTKPSGTGSLAASIAVVRGELVPKIRALCHRAPAATIRPTPIREAMSARPKRTQTTKIEAVVIGVSTGGPRALAEVIPALPADLAVPVLVVQHMPAMFTRLLAERLDASSKVTVVEGSDGMAIQAGTVYVAPGGSHMDIAGRLARHTIRIFEDPPENSCRPSVDPLFRSAAAVYRKHVLAVMLTGMGSDGLGGSKAIAAAEGQVIAQDEATSVVWGMPGEVTRAGLAEAVLPLDRIAGEISRRVAFGRTAATDRVQGGI
ncbi:MAG: chemotaxis response regulator protein-glutamate methylesterase [Actinomycetota bacterium]|nr:chemotaxis response regulator protein-glutamate methylesterase [Actinomycetota bacterium]